MFGSCCRAAARPACRQHVLLHQLVVQLLLKRSGFGTGRDRWCTQGSDWPAAAGAASTADTAGPFSAGAVAAAAGAFPSAVRRRVAWPLYIATSVTSCFRSSSEMSWSAGSESSRARRRRQCTRTGRGLRGRWRWSETSAGGHAGSADGQTCCIGAVYQFNSVKALKASWLSNVMDLWSRKGTDIPGTTPDNSGMALMATHASLLGVHHSKVMLPF